MRSLQQTAPEVAAFLRKEWERESSEITLVASENYASPAVLEAQGSILTNVYADADPGMQVVDACEHAYGIERLAVNWAKEIFGAEHANVQVHTGTQANMAVFQTLLAPGDTVLALGMNYGGHSSHGHPDSYAGRHYRCLFYGLDPATERINYEGVLEAARTHRPKLIIAGASGYPRVIDFKAFGAIAEEVGAYLLADVAHIAGLVVAGLHPNPVPNADFVTFTTHKTMGGARGGVLLCRATYAERAQRTIGLGIQSGPLMHHVAAKAVTLKEAQSDEFKQYQCQVVNNAKALASELTILGHRLISGGTDNHLMVIDLSGIRTNGDEAAAVLYQAGIAANAWPVPGQDSSPPLGLRIGTPAVTRRGMSEAEMRSIGRLIDNVLRNSSDMAARSRVRKQINTLAYSHPPYQQSQWQL